MNIKQQRGNGNLFDMKDLTEGKLLAIKHALEQIKETELLTTVQYDVFICLTNFFKQREFVHA